MRPEAPASVDSDSEAATQSQLEAAIVAMPEGSVMPSEETKVAQKKANGLAKSNDDETKPAAGTAATPQTDINPELAAKIAAVRTHIRESFGKVAMAMMMLPRYRNQTLGDLQHLLLEPLMRDRVAIAYPGGKKEGALADMAGLAIWASVSEEVDTKIREQVQAGTFPIRLKAEDWNSGDINWLLDVIAADQRTTANVIANFKQVVKEGSLRLHPIVTRLVDAETLQKMGAEKISAPERAEPEVAEAS